VSAVRQITVEVVVDTTDVAEEWTVEHYVVVLKVGEFEYLGRPRGEESEANEEAALVRLALRVAA
jgi:hypothetical protein